MGWNRRVRPISTSHPLLLTYKRGVHLVVDNTTSGQVVINDTVMHLTRMCLLLSLLGFRMLTRAALVENIPFGGIGESGCTSCFFFIFLFLYPISSDLILRLYPSLPCGTYNWCFHDILQMDDNSVNSDSMNWYMKDPLLIFQWGASFFSRVTAHTYVWWLG